MPVHKVKGGYQWGESGKVYQDKAGAENQAQAAYANGYEGKALLDAAETLSLAVLNRARHYLAQGEKPPTGASVKQGERGGKYVEIGGGQGGPVKPEFADTPLKINQPVEDWQQFDNPREEQQHWQKMAETLNGRLKQMAEAKAPLADVIKVSAKRDQAQDRAAHMAKQVKLRERFISRHNAREDEREGQQQQPAKPGAQHGKEVQAALSSFKGKMAELEAGKLQNPAEFVDAARQVAQAYEQQRKEHGAGDPKMQQARSAVERDKSILDRAVELQKLWRDRYDYAKQKGVPGEELEAVKSRFTEAGHEVMSSRMQYNESAKALYQLENPQQRKPVKHRQPKPEPKRVGERGGHRMEEEMARHQRPQMGPRKEDQAELDLHEDSNGSTEHHRTGAAVDMDDLKRQEKGLARQLSALQAQYKKLQAAGKNPNSDAFRAKAEEISEQLRPIRQAQVDEFKRQKHNAGFPDTLRRQEWYQH